MAGAQLHGADLADPYAQMGDLQVAVEAGGVGELGGDTEREVERVDADDAPYGPDRERGPEQGEERQVDGDARLSHERGPSSLSSGSGGAPDEADEAEEAAAEGRNPLIQRN